MNAYTRPLAIGVSDLVVGFGAQTVLDHLSLEFVNHGWSTKQIIRQIVLSRVYALGEVADPKNATADVDRRS